ncbi:MAG: NAD(P)H-dependent glycerol-3-phosphate dehydrogenase, partial [Chitinophagaceae bacterium]
MKMGVVGNGSWATALVKILTDNGQPVNWWIRNAKTIPAIQQRGHTPHYLSSAYLSPALLRMTDNVMEVLQQSDVVVLAVPSAYLKDLLDGLDKKALEGKKILSAVKGIVPGPDVLLNEYLHQQFGVELKDYFAVLGPCHAEEVAAEKLSYLTFSGIDETATAEIATYFKAPYINTVINPDILGVQYAAVLKNIYALGAGIAHGLDYGDNFLSVYIANSADEMAGFLKKAGIQHIVVGEHQTDPVTQKRDTNYAASVY